MKSYTYLYIDDSKELASLLTSVTKKLQPQSH